MKGPQTSDFVIRRYAVPIDSTEKPFRNPLQQAPSHSVPLLFEALIDLSIRFPPKVPALAYNHIWICSSLLHSNIAQLTRHDGLGLDASVLLLSCRAEHVFGRYIRLTVHGLAVHGPRINLAAFSAACVLYVYVRGRNTEFIKVKLVAKNMCRLQCSAADCYRHNYRHARIE